MQLANQKSTLQKIPLILLLALPLLGFILISIWFPLFPHFNSVPQLDVRSFTPSLLSGFVYAIFVIGLYGLYLHIYRRLNAKHDNVSLGQLLFSAVLYGLPLLFTYPINATDLYRYIIRGRIKSAYGLNQFVTPPNAIPNDLFATLAGEWADATSPYGPIWELTATAVTAITQDNLGAGLLVFKSLGLLFHLAIGVLIWKMTKRNSLAASWLWLGNPALLFIFVENGHNDALMLFWGMLSFYFLQEKRPYLAIVFAIFAPLTKPIGLLILPFIGLAAWRHLPSWRQKTIYTVASLGLFVGLALLVFLPFGSPLALVERLQNELIGGASFSPMTLVILILMEMEASFSFAQLSLIVQGLFGIVAIVLMWQTFNGRSAYQTVSNIFGGYLLQAFNFRLWYASWLFPWLIVEERGDSFWLNTAVYFLLTSQLSVIIYGHIRFFLLSGDIFFAHLLGVGFTFGLPILLALVYPIQSRK